MPAEGSRHTPVSAGVCHWNNAEVSKQEGADLPGLNVCQVLGSALNPSMYMNSVVTGALL